MSLCALFDSRSQARVEERAARRAAQVEEQKRLWAACWPEWEGPVVGGRCEVDAVCAYNLTHGEIRYHYMAPCRIEEMVDAETFTVVVDYADDAPEHVKHHNGERLRLDITEVWAPVRLLIEARRQATAGEAMIDRTEDVSQEIEAQH